MSGGVQMMDLSSWGMPDMASLMSQLQAPVVSSTMGGTTTGMSSMMSGSGLSDVMSMLDEMRSAFKAPARAQHPCQPDVDKYKCDGMSCLQEHAASLSKDCAEYMASEGLLPSKASSEATPQTAVLGADGHGTYQGATPKTAPSTEPSPAPMAVGYISLESTDANGNTVVQDVPVALTSGSQALMSSLMGDNWLGALLSSGIGSIISVVYDTPASYLYDTYTYFYGALNAAYDGDASYLYDTVYLMYDVPASYLYDVVYDVPYSYLYDVVYDDVPYSYLYVAPATYFYDSISEAYGSISSSISELYDLMQLGSLLGDSGSVTVYVYDEASAAPEYPCQLEVEAFCAASTSRAAIESCLVQNYESLSSSCKCFLGEAGVEVPTTAPLGNPTLRTITSASYADVVVGVPEAPEMMHAEAPHATCMLLLFTTVLLSVLLLRRCCCARPAPVQLAAIVAPPKQTMITTIEPIVLGSAGPTTRTLSTTLLGKV